MTDLKTAIQEYLKHADALLLQEIRDGTISIHEAKQDTAEIEKWRELLAVMDAAEALHGGHANTPDEAAAAMALCPYWNGEKALGEENEP